jgi:hypothetical protein
MLMKIEDLPVIFNEDIEKDTPIIPFRMESNEMSPAIRKGAILGIDVSNKNISSGEPHALFFGKPPFDAVAIRYIVSVGIGTFRLLADNPGFPAEDVKGEELLPRILGRVKWIVQKVY